jgi:hypothetical protein
MTDVVVADFLEDGGPPVQLVNSGDFLYTPPQTKRFSPPPATHSSRWTVVWRFSIIMGDQDHKHSCLCSPPAKFTSHY